MSNSTSGMTMGGTDDMFLLQYPSALSPVDAIAVNAVFTVLGLLFQIGNVAYGAKHAMHRKSPFNLILVFSLVLYALSFVPLLFTSKLSILLSILPASVLQSGNSVIVQNLQIRSTSLLVFTAFFSLSTLAYLLLVQIRFRVIKSLLPYRSIYDAIFVAVTVVLWFCTVFYFGLVNPDTNFGQSMAILAWTMYALIIDNILSFIFLYQLYKFRTKMRRQSAASSITPSGMDVWKRVVTALVVMCVVTWVIFILIMCSTFVYAKDPIMRTVLFRVGYAFTPLQFSSALVFIYSIRSLFADKVGRAEEKSTPPTKPLSPTPGASVLKSSFPIDQEPAWKGLWTRMKRWATIVPATDRAPSPTVSPSPTLISGNPPPHLPRSTSLTMHWQNVMHRPNNHLGYPMAEPDVFLTPTTTKVLTLGSVHDRPFDHQELSEISPISSLSSGQAHDKETFAYPHSIAEEVVAEEESDDERTWLPPMTTGKGVALSPSDPAHPLHALLFSRDSISQAPQGGNAGQEEVRIDRLNEQGNDAHRIMMHHH